MSARYRVMAVQETGEEVLKARVRELVEALETLLNMESDATYGARRRAEANPTHTQMDVPYHFEKARAILAKVRP